MIKAGIAGGSGYTGGELLRILSTHPETEIAFASSRKFLGKPVSSIHPSLRNFCEINFSQFSPELAKDCDVLFLCLPHGESMKIIKEIPESTRIIDLGADFRIKDKMLFETYYQTHPCPEFLGKAVYGLPELHRNEIKKARLVANPGCIATSMILALSPLAKNRILENSKIAIDVKIGSTAAGRKEESSGMHAERTGIVRPYVVSNHRHLAELKQETGLENIGITCHAVELTRGIMSTCHIFPEKSPPSLLELWETFRKAYSNEPFVRIVAKKNQPYGLPDVKTTNYSNFCEIGFAVDQHSGRIIIFSAIDNLIKGSAGQAVQNMNLMFGLDEKTGINFPGFFA